MVDIIIEIIRALIVGSIFIFLLVNKDIGNVTTIKGWKCITVGFGLLFFGMTIDITDNFDSLNQFIVIGDTKVQSILEKVVGYLFGFLLVAAGIWKWIPGIVELDIKRKTELEMVTEQLKTLTGLLPICMDCKKIRDDGGYWNQLETYLSTYSDVELSHSICDDCMEKRYPGSEDDTLE